jgi:hypothetical protein
MYRRRTIIPSREEHGMGYAIGFLFLVLSGLLWWKPEIVKRLYDHTTLSRIGGYEALGDKKAAYEREVRNLKWAAPVFFALTGVAWIAWQAGIN